ncbi:MAG: response regulator [Rickettsiaceae bacterium]
MGKVLVVEDNELNLKLFCDLLMIKHHDVLVSRDGVNVVDLVLEWMPDLILMDIQLSEISGIDLISTLKNNNETKKIPIIAITAFAMKKDEIKISETGCDLYMSKPVSIDNFFLSVERFINN